MNKITPFLWFDNNAEEAVNFYTSIFKDSKIHNSSRYGANMPLPEGTIMTISFELNGQEFNALNGGPVYKFNEAVSFAVSCKNQEEVDYYWDNFLKNGGEEGQCGWLKDKFGLSWQIIPEDLGKYLGGSDQEGAMRATQAMLQMKKLDVNILQNAYEGK